MKRLVPRSITARIAAMLGGIVLLALTATGTWMIVASASERDAAAINQAGSLRMQSYRIATHSYANGSGAAESSDVADAARELERRLFSDALVKALPDAREDPVRAQHTRVAAQWEHELGPLLKGTTDPVSRASILNAIDRFVHEVDTLVLQLQHHAEQRIQRLRWLQGLALAGILMLALASVLIARKGLVLPLRDLGRAARQVQQGDLSARARFEGSDELGLLSCSFNDTVRNLARVYTSMEEQVHDKTAELRRSNQALQLLYDVARDVNPETVGDIDFHPILQRLQQTMGLGPVTLCLANPGSRQAYQLISTAADGRPTFCSAPNCEFCLVGETRSERQPPALALPMVEERQHYGVLLVEHPPNRNVDGWQTQLADTVASHIAAARSLARQGEQQKRLALMEERAVIARELHDSLAQSLSYLKIQVTRLERTLRQDPPSGTRTDPIIDELREGLNTAYRQLRELLATFRLRIDAPGLEPALRSTVDEFARRSGIDISLDYDPAHYPLSSNEDIHILQITREALSNVLHHAGADTAAVRVSNLADGCVEVTVDDNGRGPTQPSAGRSHHGLTIMRERAGTLGGTLEMTAREEGGTRVRLRFLPAGARADTTANSGSDRHPVGMEHPS